MSDSVEISNNLVEIGSFFTVTIGILVLFIGRRVNNAVAALKNFSIPEPVTGGLIFSVLFSLFYAFTSIELEFDLTARDALLVYFFTTIGINASLQDLFKGGRPLILLLCVTIGYMVVQNLTGIGIASAFGLDPVSGLLSGSVSLIGGHGTAIAWAPRFAEEYNVASAMEIGIASATFGLILASLMGGPIAKFLVTRHNLTPSNPQPHDTSMSEMEDEENAASNTITSYDFLDAVYALHICMVLGFVLNEVISELGLQLPLFVTCLFAGILITNLMPKSYVRITGTKWPSRSKAIDLIADISLGTFLAMSLMSMQLWTLIDLAGPIFTILGAQFIIAVLVNIFIVFPAMGRNYDAAVICSGFGGISLGSTPTAMANMSAVSAKYGYSKLAFIVVPLVCAFFIDLVNAVMIPTFLSWAG
ncbi:sodium/glutamate symporter [Vibrio sp. SCSIO 43136]|uniref:sodium/glutamate symporter n=1 Tax=Vibrio sp. SCSIO 43136 TaxID=2819101 RepID=UPI002076646E|nr:sodium/glutamate symporter [Vibrio sp. SCSIO 43136]USD67413.1 sodium/glutamate symporter [Vibrio sp. SCSIO 43136]